MTLLQKKVPLIWISLKLVIVGVAFFLGHPVCQFLQVQRRRSLHVCYKIVCMLYLFYGRTEKTNNVLNVYFWAPVYPCQGSTLVFQRLWQTRYSHGDTMYLDVEMIWVLLFNTVKISLRCFLTVLVSGKSRLSQVDVHIRPQGSYQREQDRRIWLQEPDTTSQSKYHRDAIRESSSFCHLPPYHSAPPPPPHPHHQPSTAPLDSVTKRTTSSLPHWTSL